MGSIGYKLQTHPIHEPTQNDPICSVCIPTFNGEQTILETVRSVLDQSYSNIEVVISDDNSSDQTLNRLKSVVDHRLRIVRGPATGIAAENWNYSVSLARGKYIKVMGQDDLLQKDAIEVEVAALEKNQKYGVVASFCRRQIITSTGRKLPTTLLGSRRLPASIRLHSFLPGLVRSGRNLLGEPVCVTFRKDAFQKTPGFRGSYLIDLAMWLDLLQIGHGVTINRQLCAFRISRASWTFRLRGSQAEETNRFFHGVAQIYPGHVTKFDLIVGRMNSQLAQQIRRIVMLVANQR